MKVEEGFQQPVPQLATNWHGDATLRANLRRVLSEASPEARSAITQECALFADYLASDKHQDMLKQLTEPKLTQYDNWGRRIDDLHVSAAWTALKDKMVSEGLVAIPYERKYGKFSRVLYFAKTYLLSSDGRVIMCPLSMTDGCARVLELDKSGKYQEYFRGLTNRDPERSLIGAQWMTERPGGSDLSFTETTATPVTGSPNLWSLNGFKWFTSAVDGDMSLALARTKQNGKEGLSLFLVPYKWEGDKGRNGIFVHRLKKKFGTHYVPTAELNLDGARAFLVGELGRGIPTIAPILNLTRVHSATGNLGYLAKGLAIARGFAQVRKVKNVELSSNDLHNVTLSRTAIIHRALVAFWIETVVLLGASESDPSFSQEQKQLLRILTPLLKAFTSSIVPGELLECMEAMGGQGYMDETGLGELVRDSTVERIWEGTQNVLANDVVKEIKRTNGETLKSLLNTCNTVTRRFQDSFTPSFQVLAALRLVQQAISAVPSAYSLCEKSSANYRLFHHLLSNVATSVFLLKHLQFCKQTNDEDLQAAEWSFIRWVHDGKGLKAVLQDIEFSRQLEGLSVLEAKHLIYAAENGKAKL